MKKPEQRRLNAGNAASAGEDIGSVTGTEPGTETGTDKKSPKRAADPSGIPLYGKNKYLDRILEDSHFRFLTTAALSGGWNLIYAGYHVLLAVWFHSFWFLTMGLYYLVACGMRASALRLSRGATPVRERAAVKRNAVLTFAMAIIFIGIICLTIAEGRNPVKNTIVAITMAAYTFYCIVMAIRNMLLLKKQRNVQTILLRYISMLYALGAMFGLERMLLGTFGDAAGNFTLVMEAASGAGFFIVIILFGVNLFLLSSRLQIRSGSMNTGR